MEIHVAEIGVLGDVEADATAAGIAIADLEIDVAHGRIECAGIGVGDVGIGRHGVRRRKGDADRPARVGRWARGR